MGSAMSLAFAGKHPPSYCYRLDVTSKAAIIRRNLDFHVAEFKEPVTTLQEVVLKEIELGVTKLCAEKNKH